jgi:NitT/TauT family transport system ATP-binding protein
VKNVTEKTLNTVINFDTDYKIFTRNISRIFRSKRTGEKKKECKDIDNINLWVKDGEFVTVVCPSGCGKPTFLDMLAGLSEPTTGEIFIDGHNVTDPALDQSIVLQGHALFSWRTVRQNIAYGLKIEKVSKKDRHEISARFIELVGFEDHFPHELSGGMKQRVVLAYDPVVLLMDKTFAAVDAQTKEVLKDELLAIWEKTGKTIVFITHSIENAVFLADRVVVLSPGTVRAIIPVELPRPRRISNTRGAIDFSRISGQVWNLLYGIDVPAAEGGVIPVYGEEAGAEKLNLDSAAL